MAQSLCQSRRHERRQIRDVNRINVAHALFLGVVAGVGTHLVYSVARVIRPELLDIDLALGSMFFATEMQKTRVLGLIAFLCLSGLIAYVYAMVLWSARRSGAKIGLLLSFYHYLLDGLALGAFSSLGFFALGTGGGNAVMILALHMIFGSLFGLLFDWAAIRDEVPVPIDSPAPRQAQASMPERRNAVVTTSEA